MCGIFGFVANPNSKLNSINGIEDIQIIENEETIKKFIISIEENSDPRKDIFKKAVQENWTLLTMSKTSPKLEDVFKFLTIGEEEK